VPKPTERANPSESPAQPDGSQRSAQQDTREAVQSEHAKATNGSEADGLRPTPEFQARLDAHTAAKAESTAPAARLNQSGDHEQPGEPLSDVKAPNYTDPTTGTMVDRGHGENFFSKSPERSNQDVLDNGSGTPMTLDNVHNIAGRMDIDLQNVDVVIISDQEEIRYLDHMDAGAYTPSELNGTQIRLGPASFADDETLAATIAHEHTHVVQQQAGEHLHRPLNDLENEAYGSETPALERYRDTQP
jgi:hypothetical protein